MQNRTLRLGELPSRRGGEGIACLIDVFLSVDGKGKAQPMRMLPSLESPLRIVNKKSSHFRH